MDFTPTEERLSRHASSWMRRNKTKRMLVEKFIALEENPSQENPILFFTAGSPGAGKTEFLKGLSQRVENSELAPIAIIDPDEIRNLIPEYDGSNSYLFQNAVSIGISDLFRKAVSRKQNFALDGTFSNFQRAKQNIDQALTNYGNATIYYLFQIPSVAWEFTKKREALEGRNIRISDFVEKLIDSKETVEKIKKKYNDKIKLHLVVKDFNDTEQNSEITNVFLDISDIEEYLDFIYTKDNVLKGLDA